MISIEQNKKKNLHHYKKNDSYHLHVVLTMYERTVLTTFLNFLLNEIDNKEPDREKIS